MSAKWLDHEDDWLGHQRMDVPAPLPPALRAAIVKASETPGKIEKVVYWAPVRCPFCQCSKCPVRSTRGNYRHHKCQDCGKCFKSVERK